MLKPWSYVKEKPHDASGIKHPDLFMWVKGKQGVYYPARKMYREEMEDRILSLTDQVRKLASEWNGIIGHPENPFPESMIQKLVEESFSLIREPVPIRPFYSNSKQQGHE